MTPSGLKRGKCRAVPASATVRGLAVPGVPARKGRHADRLAGVKAPGVLILSPFYEPNIGGVETHLSDLASFLKKDGRLQVFVLTYQPITTRARGKYFEREGNVRVIRVPWIGMGLFHRLEKSPLLSFLYITPWLFFWTAAFLLVRGRSVGTIHAQGFNAAFIARLLSRPFGLRFLASTHAVYGLRPGSMVARTVKWALSGAQWVLALSEASKRELIGIGVDEKRVSTYTYWVDQKAFRPASRDAAKRRLGLEGRFVVLFVGRLIEAKGVDLLIGAASLLKDITFVIIGDGPLEGWLRKSSEGMGNVVFRGKAENRTLPLHYSGADLLCVPSRNEEGFGRVIIEALSCGTPVVASKKGGIPEALDSSVGVLVEPASGEIARAIEALHISPGKLSEMQGRARAYALSRFSEANAWAIVDRYTENGA